MATIEIRNIWEQTQNFIESLGLFCWLDDMEPNLFEMEQFLVEAIDLVGLSEEEFIKLYELTLADYQNFYFN